jgi:hypothetical protein
MVGDRNRAHPCGRYAPRQVNYFYGTVEERILGMDVKVDKLGSHARPPWLPVAAKAGKRQPWDPSQGAHIGYRTACTVVTTELDRGWVGTGPAERDRQDAKTPRDAMVFASMRPVRRVAHTLTAGAHLSSLASWRLGDLSPTERKSKSAQVQTTEVHLGFGRYRVIH